MCSNKSNPYNLNIVIDSNNQPVVVALDIEHNAVVIQDTRRRVHQLDVLRRLPGSVIGLAIPRL